MRAQIGETAVVGEPEAGDERSVVRDVPSVRLR